MVQSRNPIELSKPDASLDDIAGLPSRDDRARRRRRGAPDRKRIVAPRILAALALGWSVTASAGSLDVADWVPKPSGPEVRLDWIHEPKSKVQPLASLGRTYLAEQRARVDAAARRRLGQALSREESDLEILQRIVDQRLFAPSDRESLQALGVVLGDLLVDRYGYRWITWIDDKGKSRALQHPANGRVIFPITAISQRVEVGLPVDVKKIYEGLSPDAESTEFAWSSERDTAREGPRWVIVEDGA